MTQKKVSLLINKIRLNYDLEIVDSKTTQLGKLQLLVMNYKFSNRELILLKALTAIVLL